MCSAEARSGRLHFESYTTVTTILGQFACHAPMPKTKETDQVTFVAEYRDGTFAHFDIDPWTLRGGNWVARIIARERQQDGSLKPGEIIRVYPARRG